MSLGQLLRAAREEKGITLQDVEEELRIRVHLLQAMESDSFDKFPSPVIARGFIRNYAKYLGLDPIDALQRYDGKGFIPIKGQRMTATGIEFMDLSMTPRPFPWDILVGAVLTITVLGVVGYWGYTQVVSQVQQTVAVVRAPEGVPEITPVDPNSPEGVPLDTPTPLPTNTPTPVPPTETPTPIVYRGVTTELIIRESSWVRVIVDDVEVFEGILQTGDSRIWTGERRVTLRAGNAGGVEVIVNGNNQGLMGPAGQVVDQVWEKVEEAAVPPIQPTATGEILLESTTPAPVE